MRTVVNDFRVVLRDDQALLIARALDTLSEAQRDAVVKGVSAFDGVALINLEGAGMIGVPGTADRLFGALRDAGISVMLISQGKCYSPSEYRVGDRAQGAFVVQLVVVKRRDR